MRGCVEKEPIVRSILAFATAATLTITAFAQQPASDQDHAAHHADGASAAVAAKKALAAKPKAAASAQSTGMGMGADMGKMHDQMHKPGGMHDKMHETDGKMMGGQMPAMPAASAASR